MYGHILIAGCRFELLGKPRCFQSTRPRRALTQFGKRQAFGQLDFLLPVLLQRW